MGMVDNFGSPRQSLDISYIGILWGAGTLVCAIPYVSESGASICKTQGIRRQRAARYIFNRHIGSNGNNVTAPNRLA